MIDNLSDERRSENMRRIRSADTRPEMIVRRIVHGLGFRYRLHRRDLPGRPDLVFPRLKCVIFVHGCFWHLHPGCAEGRIPGTRTEYWGPKLRANFSRDCLNRKALEELGWEVLVVWECETKDRDGLTGALRRFLGSRVGPESESGM